MRFLLALLALVAAPAALAQTVARSDGAEATQGTTILRVTALTDSILRVRIARDGRFPEDASWAVPAAARAQHIAVTPAANGFATNTLRVQIGPALRLTVTDSAGKTIVADDADPVKLDGTSFTLRKAMPLGEHYYGLGDKTGPYDRRGASYVDWNTDAYGYGTSTDPVYKSIPFTLSVGGQGGAYGIFLDNTWRAWFDFGHRDDNVLAFGSPDGPIDYYIIAGPTPAEVVRRYTDLTGKAPLAPRWALGFQQSRYSYMSDAEVREIAGRMRSDKIPLDVIWLDIDYQDRNRPFTVNAKTFPDLKKLAGDLRTQGIRLVAITDLHVAAAPGQGYAPYDSGEAGGHFVRKPDGSTYVGPVWPGPSVFPDFTREASRIWWGTLFAGFLDDGIAGFWNDMNEPAVFDTPTKTMPLGNLHRIDSDDFTPRDATHAEIHNVYGMENSRATFEGLKRLRPNDRPFVMTRASYAGGQRYAVTWTGDNSSSWEHLKLSVQQLVNLGLSGFSYAGADVGGFTGGPSPDLLTKWIEIAAFTPVFRIHAATGQPRTEPWVDGPGHLAIRRRFIEERYRLLPYLYAVAEENARTGDPIMRPVWYDNPEAVNAPCDQSMAFTLGHDLLIASSPKPDSPEPYDICLPAGGWYDYWSGMPVHKAKLTETPSLAKLPVFVRAGAILPRQPLVQSTDETPQGPLQLDVYVSAAEFWPGRPCEGELYLDDGATANSERMRQTITCVALFNVFRIEFSPRQGRYQPWWKQITVNVHGYSRRVFLNGKAIPFTIDNATDTLRFTLPDMRDGGEVVLFLIARRAPPKARLILFAFGDFAFNLYWQSIMLFLLFYYTDALNLPMATASAIYFAASVWDGIVNFAAGAVTDRKVPRGGYGRVLVLGSVPLALACILTYVPPLATGFWGIALVAVGHLLFRTAYAAVNVPYLAMTARISVDSKDRAFVAGMRMLFGTMAWVLVARGTVPIGAWLSGSAVAASAYLGAAIFFAIVATAILMLVGITYREDAVPEMGERPSVLAGISSLLANRAFVTLNLAMMAMIVAVTVLNKSVLYYFKYFLGDTVAGEAALGWMGLVSAVAVPAWMLSQRYIGTRTVWFVASGLCIAGLIVFALVNIDRAYAMQLLLIGLQAAIVGLHFSFWAMLPNTIEFGERTTGLRVEGAVFGLASLLQRVAIGLATGILGLGFESAGYVANVHQSAGTLAVMRWTITLVPLGFLALAWLLMLLNPLGKGEHARIVRELAGG